MKLLVCGGRNFNHEKWLYRILDEMQEKTSITLIINGGAAGADKFAREWAKLNAVPVKRLDAEWRRYGKAAGPIRNQAMLALKPDLVVGFMGGSGTMNMLTLAREASIPTLHFYQPPDDLEWSH